MNFITKYQKYFIVIFISFILGLTRWVFFDKKLPLFGLSQVQQNIQLLKNDQDNKKSINCKNLADLDFIDFKAMKDIASNKAFPIIDARDQESYNEGHIDGAINLDGSLLVEYEDINEINKAKKIFENSSSDCVILYCWNPDCDAANYLRYFLTNNNLIPESKISIYEPGWDEWNLLYKPN